MADDATKVRVGFSGEVYYAATSATKPTNATTAVDAAFTANLMGYLSEDGISTTINADVEDIKAWQNGDVVRKVQTSSDYTLQFTAIELNPNTLEAYFGNYTAVDSTSGSAEITGEQLPHKSWIFDVVDGDARVRIVVPDGQITERGDIPVGGSAPISLPMTVTAFPDSSGVKAYIYVDHDVNTSS
jgi:hypothetical protein